MISFRVFGCVIELRFLFVALVTLAVLLDTSSYMRSTLLAAVVHECGHLLVLAGYHALPRKIRFGISNIDMIDPQKENRGYKRDIVVLLAGAGMNLLAGGFLLGGAFLLKSQWMLFYAYANLLTGFFNLLPIDPLDGGQIVYAFLCQKLPEEKANGWVEVISFVALTPVALAGFLLLLRSAYNFSLLLTSCYLMAALLLKRRPGRENAFPNMEHKAQAKDGLKKYKRTD